MRTPLRCWCAGLAALIAVLLGGATPAQNKTEDRPPAVSADPHDWPMYNRDVLGTRHNPAEKVLGRDNVGKLVEKWRFPPADAKEHDGEADKFEKYFSAEPGSGS